MQISSFLNWMRWIRKDESAFLHQADLRCLLEAFLSQTPVCPMTSNTRHPLCLEIPRSKPELHPAPPKQNVAAPLTSPLLRSFLLPTQIRPSQWHPVRADLGLRWRVIIFHFVYFLTFGISYLHICVELPRKHSIPLGEIWHQFVLDFTLSH